MPLKGSHVEHHGMSYSSEYRIWGGMVNRCTNPNHHKYPIYGKRGIAVCEKWMRSFTQFYTDMGPRPSPNHQIERLDNNGPYSPDNCVWATRIEQGNNKRNNCWLTIQGKKQTLSQWSQATGLPISTIYNRFLKGDVGLDLIRPPDPKKSYANSISQAVKNNRIK